MNRPRIARIGVALVALAALPAAYIGIGRFTDAEAQGFPPEPPSTYWGTFQGASAGDGVVASIGSGASSRTCGTGAVLTDNSQSVYVIDVITDDQTSGCGDTGRTVRFYLAPKSPGGGGKFATQVANWQSAGAHQQNLTAGSALPFVLYLPQMRGQVTH
jgi:hypothetical protein